MDINTIRKVIVETAGSKLQEIISLREIRNTNMLVDFDMMNIPSTMGEPLMYKDFPELINICKQYNVKMNLTTNGTFLNRGTTEWAQMIVPVASDVKISWNGVSGEVQDKVMIGSKYDAKLANLVEFIRVRDEVYKETGHRCTVTLQLTFMEMNVHELPDVVRLGIKLGVDRIKGHHLWAHFKGILLFLLFLPLISACCNTLMTGIENQSMRRNPQSITKWNAIARECINIAETTPLPPLSLHHNDEKSGGIMQNSKKIRLENIYELEESATNQIHPQATCPFLGKEAWVNHEGRCVELCYCWC
jgi:hypothetical protein